MAAPLTGEEREALDNRNAELLLAFLLRADSTCIDVGAHQGRFLYHCRRHAPLGRHLAFEPLPQLAAGLREAFPDVEVHEVALSDEPGETEFVVVPEDLGYSGLRERAYPGDYRTERIPVQVRRLDDLLPPGLRVDFLKVDVEGAELGLFRGALRMLRRDRPTIVFEHGPGAADRYGTTSEDVHDLLVGDAGLRIYDLDGDGPYERSRFADVFASGTRWNWVAHA